jgi:phosphate/phosphite/phosphonate ABC transporter binding protein
MLYIYPIAHKKEGWKMKRGKRDLIFLVLGIFLSFELSVVQAAELKFGFTPVLGEADMREEFQPLMNYMTKSTGIEVMLYIAKSYGDLREQMEAGKVDIGSFSPFAYVDAAKGGKIKIIAQSILDHSAFYRGLIIARKSSGITDVAGLKGKRFAFVDPKSASGYVYPRAMLIEKGFDPDKFFKETIFAGGHDKVIVAVLDGKVEAGAIYDGALAIAKGKGLKVEDLSTIASTEPIPHDAIVVRSDMDDATAGKIQKSLIDLEKTEEGKEAIAKSKKKLTGHILADDKTFDVVRRTAKIAGMK